MSRDIKFRVWHKQNKVMMWLKQIVWFPDSEERITAFPFDQREKNFTGSLCHLEMMEYTGINDKNGREIFEGDIVFDGFVHKVVVQHQGSWQLKRDYSGLDDGEPYTGTFYTPLWMWIEKINTIEVVGNIYENPELLKQYIEIVGNIYEKPKL